MNPESERKEVVIGMCCRECDDEIPNELTRDSEPCIAEEECAHGHAFRLVCVHGAELLVVLHCVSCCCFLCCAYCVVPPLAFGLEG